MNITKSFIEYNFNKGRNTKQYIVIHDTGNTKAGADAVNHFKYFNNGERGASAHYFVDDKRILQLVRDDDRSWHCGKKYGVAPMSQVNNDNSIGIEICVNSDGDYKKAFDYAVELTKILMEMYDIQAKNVVRHYDACLKTCPASMSKNNWQLWADFKKKIIEEKVAVKGDDEVVTKTTIIIDGKRYEADRILKDGRNFVELRSFEKAGYTVGYDTATKTPIFNK